MTKYFKEDENGTLALMESTEEEVIAMLSEGKINIVDIVDPTADMLMVIVESKQASQVQFTHDIPNDIMIKLIKKYPHAVQYFPDIDERFKKIAVRANPTSIQVMRNLDIKTCLQAIRANPFIVEYCPPSEELTLEALTGNALAVGVAPFINESLIMKAIKKDPLVIISFIRRDIMTTDMSLESDFKYWGMALGLNPYLIRLLTVEGQKQIPIEHVIELDKRVINLIKDKEFRETLLEKYSK